MSITMCVDAYCAPTDSIRTVDQKLHNSFQRHLQVDRYYEHVLKMEEAVAEKTSEREWYGGETQLQRHQDLIESRER